MSRPSSPYALVASALLAAGVLARPLTAQVVRGAIAERGSRAPLPGVVVSLEDDAGRAVVSVLSDAQGGYEVRAPASGRYTLVAKRIGVRPARVGPFELGASEVRREAVDLEALVPSLTAVRVTGTTACRRTREGDDRLASLWEDTRAALTAATITARGGDRAWVQRFEREVDTETGRIVKDERSGGEQALDRIFKSIPVDRLESEGYVVTREQGMTDYYAPDADVLVSEQFLGSHCFRIVAGENQRAKQVGLQFSPTRDAGRPDITGTLWLDRATSELREIHYTYTALPRGIPGDPLRDGIGGTVRYARLGDGRWIVDDWKIRMPIAATRRRADEAPRLTRVREAGGTVTIQRRGAALAERTGATVTGVVYDSATKGAARGAVVSLDGTPFRASTDSTGRFTFTDVASGAYTILLASPALDSLGLRIPGALLDVTGTGTIVARLALPSMRSRAARMCREGLDVERQAAARITVVDAGTGEPLRAVPIRATWAAYGVVGRAIAETTRDLEVTLDDSGQATLCGLPVETLVRIAPVEPGRGRWRDSLRLAAGELAALTLRPVVSTAIVAGGGDEPRATGGGGATSATGRPAGAADRRRPGGRNASMTSEEIEGRGYMRVSDALRAMGGVRVVPLPLGSGFAAAIGTPPTTSMVQVIESWPNNGERFPAVCYMQVFVDNQRWWSWGSQPPTDIDVWSITILSKIEVFRSPGETPPAFGGTGAICGTVVLSTKRR